MKLSLQVFVFLTVTVTSLMATEAFNTKNNFGELSAGESYPWTNGNKG